MDGTPPPFRHEFREVRSVLCRARYALARFPPDHLPCVLQRLWSLDLRFAAFQKMRTLRVAQHLPDCPARGWVAHLRLRVLRGIPARALRPALLRTSHPHRKLYHAIDD